MSSILIRIDRIRHILGLPCIRMQKHAFKYGQWLYGDYCGHTWYAGSKLCGLPKRCHNARPS